MEQVQKTLPELLNHGFCELEMHEVIVRHMDVDESPFASTSRAKETVGKKHLLRPSLFTAKHKSDSRGHTSYLYSATLLPAQPLP